MERTSEDNRFQMTPKPISIFYACFHALISDDSHLFEFTLPALFNFFLDRTSKNAAVGYLLCFLISPEYIDAAAAEHARTAKEIPASGSNDKDDHSCLSNPQPSINNTGQGPQSSLHIVTQPGPLCELDKLDQCMAEVEHHTDQPAP